MAKVSEERANEVNAAWQAASMTERLRLPRIEWFAADTTTYYELPPTELETHAAKRIAELEGALANLMQKSADHIIAGHPINADALVALREAELVLAEPTCGC